ncbi:MAG: MFS transporter [Oleiphilaceae bacterium]|nr:MFS transporter [Oleiphilaceae bacterium]
MSKPSDLSQAMEGLYDYVANEEDARVCKDISDQACREVPGNFFLILLSQCLTKLGDALASTKIVLPWVMAQSGVPAFFTGVLVPIRESGALLPQLMLGSVIRAYAVRKWFFVAGCLLQGLAVLAMAWIAFSMQGVQAGVAIVLALVVFSLARGMCSVASKDVLGKTIPKTRRGRVSGLAASISGFITLGVAVVLWLDLGGSDDQLVWLLAGAALLWLLAAVVFARIAEYSGATDGGGNAIKEAFSRLSLLREDPPFRRFVIVRALLMSSGLSAPFFILLAQSPDGTGQVAQLSLFIGVSGLASLLSGNIWGRFADRSSRTVMLCSGALTALLCALAIAGQLVWGDIPVLIVVALYFVLAIAHQGVRLGRKTYVVDMAGGNKRTDYVAVSNTLIGALLLLAGIISAAIAQWSLIAVFAFFGLACLLALLVSRGLPEV